MRGLYAGTIAPEMIQAAQRKRKEEKEMFSKCACGGIIFPFVDTERKTEGRKCDKCGIYLELKNFHFKSGIDYEEMILARQEENDI